MGKKKGGKHITKKQLTAMVDQLFQQNPTTTFELKTLFRELDLTTHPAKMLCMDILKDMLLDDHITEKPLYCYTLNNATQVMEGIFHRKANGKNSFVPDGGEKPILVAERNSLHAMDGDRVQAVLLARRRGHMREAQVTEILQRSEKTFVGQLLCHEGLAFLSVEDRTLANDILIPRSYMKGAKAGDKVIVKIVEWPARANNPVGKVVEILGKAGENEAEMHAILAEYGLPYSYPKQVEEAANYIPAEIPQEEIDRREDMRDVLTFTIDPRDAKDFDDALSIRQIGSNLWEVGVHIADVSYYVPEGSIIDKEAQRRATSIYLVDRTIPMLPERLCNEICSLRPDEDKLTYSVIFEMNAKADVKRWHLAHTVTRSNRRFTYEEVQEILEALGEASPEDYNRPGDTPPQPSPVGEGVSKSPSPLINSNTNSSSPSPAGEGWGGVLTLLNRMAKELRRRRFANGAVDFDRCEPRFEIDEKGHPTGVYFKVAKDANKLIEEFMLLANRTVAESIGKPRKGTRGSAEVRNKAKTFVYRIHDLPDPNKLMNLSDFVLKFGHKLRSTGSRNEVSQSINKLLHDVRGKREQNMVEMVTLRAMMKAKYSTFNIGHYGLAFDFYTHFTSPIRRYPDLMVHRLLTRYAEGGRSAMRDKYEDLCDHSSEMEQLAAQAERSSIKYKQVEFMHDHLGEEYAGTICGVAEYGLYVEVNENKCEGMVSIRDLNDDYYYFDEKNFSLVGRHKHHRFTLGDQVRVKVAGANLDRKQLEFVLVRE